MTPPQKPLIIPIFIPHSGCPHRCVFCNQSVITGASRPLPDENDIHAIIDQFLSYKRPNRFPVEVSFYGGNFLGLAGRQVQRLLSATAPYTDAGKVNALRFSTRPDTIDADRLDLIRGFPVATVEIGVQSMDDRVLALSQRGHTAADTIDAVALLRQNGYRVGLQIMIGLPGDSKSGALETARAVIALGPDFVRIYPALVLEGSLLAAWYRQGRYPPLCLEECIAQTKSLYLLFKEHHIPVIRMGLQASEGLNRKDGVLAGPYHPALGHLVLSDILLDTAASALNAKVRSNHIVTLTVHPKSLSRMQGLNKRNLDVLKHKYHLQFLRLKTDSRMEMDAVTAE